MGTDHNPTIPLYDERGEQIGEVRVRLELDGRIVTFAVVLVAWESGRANNVRVYDNAHGHAEMHRYTRDGRKLEGEPFPGEVEEAFNAALDAVCARYAEMIDSWRRQ